MVDGIDCSVEWKQGSELLPPVDARRAQIEAMQILDQLMIATRNDHQCGVGEFLGNHPNVGRASENKPAIRHDGKISLHQLLTPTP